MSKLPQSLNIYNVTKENIEEFKGIDHNERTQNGAWYDMKNMTLDDYPVASVRNKRGIVSSNYSNTIKSGEVTLKTSVNANDAVIVNENVSLLQNCTANNNDTKISGQVVRDTNDSLISLGEERITGTIMSNEHLLREFQDKWCFIGRGEPICNINGRWYEYRTCEFAENDDIALGAVVTVGDWTFPMLIAKKEKTIKIYYSDVFYGTQPDINWKFQNCTALQQFQDKYHKKWYVSQNSAAWQLGSNEEEIKGKICGKAQYLGKFEDWKSAAQALLDVYNDESEKETEHYFYTTGLDKKLDHKIHKFDEPYKESDFGKIHLEPWCFQHIDYECPSYVEMQIVDMSEKLLCLFEKEKNKSIAENEEELVPYVQTIINKYYEEYQGAFVKGKNSAFYYYSDYEGKVHNASERVYWCSVLIRSNNRNICKAVCFNSNGSYIGTNDYIQPHIWAIELYFRKDCLTWEELTPSNWDIYDKKVLIELSNNFYECLLTDRNLVTIAEFAGLSGWGAAYIDRPNVNKNAFLISFSQLKHDWVIQQQNYPNKTKIAMTTALITNLNTLKNVEVLKQSDYNDKKAMIKCGTKILVVPDGVIIDTKSGETKKIAYKETFTSKKGDGVNSFIYTCDGDENTFNAGFFKLNPESDYRIVNGVVQKKVKLADNSVLWSDISTYVNFTFYDEGKFEKFSKGDNVEVSLKLGKGQITDLTKFKKGMFEYDNATGNLKSNSYRIQKVGNNFIDLSAVLINYEESENSWITGFGNSENEYEITFEKKFPNVQPFGALCGNRVWLCQKDGHEIYASALGDYTNYYDYSGLNSDSWSANVGSDGEFTGIVNYLGNILIFKEDTLYIVYGSAPSEFSYTEVNNFKGVEKGSERSFAIIDNVLYYKSVYGIIAYDGSTTVISSALGREKYKNAVAGAWGNKYYVSMQNCKTNKYELFCYDTKKGMWTKEAEDRIIRFLNDGNTLYYVTDTKVKIIDADNDYEVKEDNVSWSAETGIYGYSYPNQKYISRLQLRMYLAQGAKARIYIQYNSNGKWQSCGREIIGRGVNSFIFPIRPQRCDHMKLKIEGEGECKIYSLTKCLEVGGEL